MSSWGSYSFLYGPFIALVALAGLALVAHWASRSNTSLIAAPPRRGAAEEYGLMIPVASPTSPGSSRAVAAQLAAAGMQCREVDTTEGRRVMVWAEDLARARSVLDNPGR